MNKRKNYIYVNEEFVCEQCGTKNPPQKGGCRNHCIKCIYSKHVDKDVPGDRKSECKGLMEPVEINLSGKKGYIITHRCLKCGKEINNMKAPDDDFDVIIKISAIKRI